MERPQPQLGTQNKTASDRVLAWFVDRFIIIAVSIVVGWSYDSFIATGVSDPFYYFLVAWLVGSFGYHTYFEATYGQTLGKKLLNVVVVSEDGEPCDWLSSTIRNGVRIVDSIPFYFVGIIAMFLSDNDQRLGDIAASTIVTEVVGHPDNETESDFEIELHRNEALEESYLELLNKSGEKVDLSRGTLRTDSGSEFRFPQGETVHRSGDSKTFLVSEEFTIEPGNSVTLLTRSGRRYDVSWQRS